MTAPLRADDDAPAEAPSSAMELARTVSAGDLEATAALVKRVAPRVIAVVRALLGAQSADVEDVVQQSLIAFVQALPAFRGECDPIGYASRIAARTAVTARRRRRAQPEAVASGLDEEPSGDATPDEIAASGRRAEMLRQLLETLPEEQAECLALRVVLGWTLEEVAAATRVPVNTVRSRVRLAKEAMRRRIEANPILRDELSR